MWIKEKSPICVGLCVLLHLWWRARSEVSRCRQPWLYNFFRVMPVRLTATAIHRLFWRRGSLPASFDRGKTYGARCPCVLVGPAAYVGCGRRAQGGNARASGAAFVEKRKIMKFLLKTSGEERLFPTPPQDWLNYRRQWACGTFVPTRACD